jgi:catechol 2,3-dioxygenase-like lactoylglutathione lyase family enzyme
MSDSACASSSKVSSRAKRGTCFLLVFWASLPFVSHGQGRPKILGIAGITVVSTDYDKSRSFYEDILDLSHMGTTLQEGTKAYARCDPNAERCFALSEGQAISLVSSCGGDVRCKSDALFTVAFLTSDASKLRQYLKSLHIGVSELRLDGKEFSAIDPDNHRIQFIDASLSGRPTASKLSPSTRMIHAGFVVRDRQAEDKFYKDILGFHVYWHGGMKDGEDNWVDMQVPDGSDWIEYMLGVSPDASHKTLGVMNHIALGVPDIHAAQQQLIKNGWKGTEEPKIGRDGKWQLNLYDPDETRVELMEFKPTKEPCCSAYTGPHPGPAQ